MQLQDKVALITGASRGIGKAVALQFAREGASIAAVYAGNHEAARETAAEIESLGARVKTYACDVSDFNATGELVKAVLSDFGQVDILVNNAGITRDGLILSMKEEDFDLSLIHIFLALFLSPIFLAIPGFATAPALVFVGLMMMKSVLKMHFDGDIADSIGGFVAVIFMPFTYSIANGIMFGILAWVFLKIFTGKIKDIHPVMWVSAALFVLRILTLVVPALSI